MTEREYIISYRIIGSERPLKKSYAQKTIKSMTIEQTITKSNQFTKNEHIEDTINQGLNINRVQQLLNGADETIELKHWKIREDNSETNRRDRAISNGRENESITDNRELRITENADVETGDITQSDAVWENTISVIVQNVTATFPRWDYFKQKILEWEEENNAQWKEGKDNVHVVLLGITVL